MDIVTLLLGGENVLCCIMQRHAKLRGLSFPNLLLSYIITSSMTFLSTCVIFNLSTSHMIVHFRPLIVLFATYLSYSYNLNSHSIRL